MSQWPQNVYSKRSFDIIWNLRIIIMVYFANSKHVSLVSLYENSLYLSTHYIGSRFYENLLCIYMGKTIHNDLAWAASETLWASVEWPSPRPSCKLCSNGSARIR